jgi:hypothetical protein
MKMSMSPLPFVAVFALWTTIGIGTVTADCGLVESLGFTHA